MRSNSLKDRSSGSICERTADPRDCWSGIFQSTTGADSNQQPGLIRCRELLDHSTVFTVELPSGVSAKVQSVASESVGSATIHELDIQLAEGSPSQPAPSTKYSGDSGEGRTLGYYRTLPYYLLCSDAGFAEMEQELLPGQRVGELKHAGNQYVLGYRHTDPRHIRIRPGLIIPTTFRARGYQLKVKEEYYELSTAELVAVGPVFAFGGWGLDSRGRLRFRRVVSSVRLCPSVGGVRKCRYAWLL